MCGIAGYLSPDSDETVIHEQLDVLAHRGPDSYGVFGGRGAVIGQTRLSIIDLVTGDPPIVNEEGDIGVAFNGEIYNYRSLREGLLRRGHDLKTQGDTEVLAHLAEEMSPVDMARSLDGMFAFAVWDKSRRRLVLARDRFGKKPLYYFHRGVNHFVFASEIKALRLHPDVSTEIDIDAIPALLTFGYVPSPRSFFKDIRSVPPGSVLVVEDGREPTITRYWEPPKRPVGDVGSFRGTFDDATKLVRAHLNDAVSKRLISDVPLGAYLSGGIDSSAIVALMSDLSRDPVKTFTIGFEDQDGFDERRFARKVAQRFHTDHHEFVVAPDAIDLVERLVWHHDQPFGDSSAIPTYMLAEITRRHVTVALTGDGGDELFGGYERFSAALAVERFRSLPKLIRRGAGTIADVLPRHLLRGRAGSIARFVNGAELGLPDAYLHWLSYATREDREALVQEPNEWAWEHHRGVWDSTEGINTLDRLLDLNLRTYLLDDLLPKADRMSMAHGLEVRSPFLDTELAEFVLMLPPEMKVKAFSRKRVLRAALTDALPREILNRRKSGFGVPLNRWFREDLRSYAHSMLGQNARCREFLRGPAIDAVLARHVANREDHGDLLWALLTLEVFLRRESV